MKVLKQIWLILNRKEKFEAIGLFCLLFIGACFETLGIGLIMPYIALINNPSSLNKYKIFIKITELLHLSSTNEIIIGAGVGLIIIYLLKNLVLSFIFHIQFKFIFNRQSSISAQLLEAYLQKPYTFHLERNTAELLRNINNEVIYVFNYIMLPLFILMAEVLVVSLTISLLIILEPLPSLIAFSLLGGAITIFYLAMRKKNYFFGQAQQNYYGEMIKWVNQALGGIKEIKLLGRENYFIKNFSKNSHGYAKAQEHLQISTHLPRLFIETLTVLGLTTIVITMLYQGKNSQNFIPVLALFAMSAIRLMPSMNRIINSATSIRYHKPALTIVCQDLLNTPIKDKEQTEINTKHDVEISFNKTIELKNISYKYPLSKKMVLDNISLTISRGTSIAFAGPSGAGKTTLVDLILGLLKPTEGKILVDGLNIDEDLLSWQKKIGYIPQTIYFVDDTIRRNVAFGVEDNAINEGLVWEALKNAQLYDFINDLPDKLDTFVGERGIRLSGGQRQRLGIARALYYNPEILVLDEATSALDYEIEKEITKIIQKLCPQKTGIIISHRLSTIEHCSQIFNILNGEVTGLDAHQKVIHSSPYSEGNVHVRK